MEVSYCVFNIISRQTFTGNGQKYIFNMRYETALTLEKMRDHCQGSVIKQINV